MIDHMEIVLHVVFELKNVVNRVYPSLTLTLKLKRVFEYQWSTKSPFRRTSHLKVTIHH